MKNISISCYQLQDIIKRPDLHGVQLAINLIRDSKQYFPFNTAMSKRWKTVVKDVHHGKINKQPGRERLEKLLKGFSSITEQKRDLFLDSFDFYFQQLERERYQLRFSSKDFKWQGLHQDIVLSGELPWIAEQKGHFLCYYILEQTPENWLNDLKYPLLQHYISGNVLKTDSQDVSIGIYSIVEKAFTQTTFSKSHINISVNKGKDLFDEVHHYYRKTLGEYSQYQPYLSMNPRLGG